MKADSTSHTAAQKPEKQLAAAGVGNFIPAEEELWALGLCPRPSPTSGPGTRGQAAGCTEEKWEMGAKQQWEEKVAPSLC